MLLLSLFILWLILNARITAEILLIGLPVALAVFGLLCRALGWTLRKDLRLLCLFPKLIGFLALLFREILFAALRVFRLVWAPRPPVSAAAEFDPRVRTRPGQVVLADSITLTPGTITVETEPGRFLVHCLEASSAPGLPEGPLARKIRNLEDHAA